MLQNVSSVDFSINGDSSGSLIALEGLSREVPFEIKRIYYIFDTTPRAVRGKHAHRSLRQVLICLSGSCVVVCDNGEEKTEYHMAWPDKGLLIEGLVWREMRDFSKGTVLLVLASEGYDEADYIRDYGVFLKEIKHG